MRVSVETLNPGWVGMGWWVSGLLLGPYNNTTHNNISLFGYARQRKNLVLRWVGECAGVGCVM